MAVLNFLCPVFLILSVINIARATQIEKSLLDEVSDLTKKVHLLEHYLRKESVDINTQDKEKDFISYHRLKGDNRIGFTASLTHSLSSLSKQQLIPFDKVTSNLGNTYNKGTGIYTCALTGNYFLSATVTAAHDATIHANIVVDGQRVASMYAKTGTSGVLSQGSNSAVAHCNQGQSVAVQVVEGNSIYGSTTSPLTSFTGFLIWDD